MGFFLNVCRSIVRTALTVVRLASRWAWTEPVEARGWPWTVCLWLAIGLGTVIARRALLPFLTFLVVQWVMGRIGRPKLLTFPKYRR